MNKSEMRRLAEEANADEMPASAVLLYRKLLAKGDDRPSIRLQLSENLRQLERFSEAEQVIDEVKEVPDSKRWLIFLSKGEISMDKGDLASAEFYFRECAFAKPESTVPWVYLGRALFRLGRATEAIEALQSGLRATGDIDEVHLNLGLYARSIGDFPTAKKHLVKAAEMDSSCEKAKNALRDVSMCLELTECK